MTATATAALNLQAGQPIELDTHSRGYMVVNFQGVRGGRLRFRNFSGPLHSVELSDIVSVKGLHYN